MSKAERLRAHYDSTDQTDALAETSFEDESEPDVLVSTSIRLSKDPLDAVRARAQAAGVPVTTLMRVRISSRRAIP